MCTANSIGDVEVGEEVGRNMGKAQVLLVVAYCIVLVTVGGARFAIDNQLGGLVDRVVAGWLPTTRLMEEGRTGKATREDDSFVPCRQALSAFCSRNLDGWAESAVTSVAFPVMVFA